MSQARSDGLRVIAFGAADGSLWGAAFDHGPRALVAGAGPAATGLAEGIEWSDADDSAWRLAADGVALTATPLTAPVPAPDAAAAPGAPYVEGEGPQLCRVHGTLTGQPVDAVGARAVLPAPSSAKDLPVSARIVGAWFPDGAALGVLAARPSRAAHQDGETATATLFDPERWIAVGEPRLSTTFDGSGSPTRCNLELWVSEGDNEFPRRAAAEASAAGAAVATEGLAIEVVPLRCHSRGEAGAGVYAVATF